MGGILSGKTKSGGFKGRDYRNSFKNPIHDVARFVWKTVFNISKNYSFVFLGYKFSLNSIN